MSFLLNISLRYQLSRNKFSFSRILNRYPAFSNFPPKDKCLSSTEENGNQGPKQTFKEIFRFSYIKFGLAINKFKWPQTVLVALALPNSVAMYFGGIIDLDILACIVFSGLVITGNVYMYGNFFHDAVGFMYLSEDENTLKISYLDFWGRRVNKEVPVNDVMPLADCPRSPIDHVYRTIHFYSTEKVKFKLYLKTGGKVTDEDKFIRVFGDYKKY